MANRVFPLICGNPFSIRLLQNRDDIFFCHTLARIESENRLKQNVVCKHIEVIFTDVLLGKRPDLQFTCKPQQLLGKQQLVLLDIAGKRKIDRQCKVCTVSV